MPLATLDLLGFPNLYIFGSSCVGKTLLFDKLAGSNDLKYNYKKTIKTTDIRTFGQYTINNIDISGEIFNLEHEHLLEQYFETMHGVIIMFSPTKIGSEEVAIGIYKKIRNYKQNFEILIISNEFNNDPIIFSDKLSNLVSTDIFCKFIKINIKYSPKEHLFKIVTEYVNKIDKNNTLRLPKHKRSRAPPAEENCWYFLKCCSKK